ncbi:hypothetical protein S245_024265, partial [Arachis hypogaea]
ALPHCMVDEEWMWSSLEHCRPRHRLFANPSSWFVSLLGSPTLTEKSLSMAPPSLTALKHKNALMSASGFL